MTSAYQRLLLQILAAVAITDFVWGVAQHSDVDLPIYLLLGLLSAAFFGLAIFYARVRQEEHLSAMLFSTGFLLAYSPLFSMLNYLLLTVAGPLIDQKLAAIDRAMGFNWPALMALVADYPMTDLLLKFVYSLAIPEIALLIICLGWQRRSADIYKFSLVLVLAGGITVAFWTLYPSFGPYMVYSLSRGVTARLDVLATTEYQHGLYFLLQHGPGRLSPYELKGLVAFPSYHTAFAVMAAWYARSLRGWRWPFFVFNAGIVIATPIQGGHHLIDVIGGIGVAAVSIYLVERAIAPNLVSSKPRIQSASAIPAE